jgi:uncharacterized protein YukE
MTNTAWTQSGEVLFTTGASDTTALISAWAGQASAAYFDDFTVVEVTDNLGFENDFTSWSTYGTASINTANVHSEAKSGYFTNGGGNYVVTGLKPNTTYSMKGWVKAVSGSDIWITVDGYGGNKVGAQMTNTAWTQSGEVLFTTGASDTTALISAWAGQASAAYFDDFTVAPSCNGCRTAAVEPNLTNPDALTLQVYPNPASHQVRIELSDFRDESGLQIKITDLKGKVFISQQLQAYSQQVSVSVADLPQGLFLVRVQGYKKGKTAKLIIAK